MRQKVKLPRLADTTDDFVIVSWEVEVGSSIQQGDVLATVETDKTEMELPSPVSGTVVELLVEKGGDVHTGDPICVIEA